MSWYAETFSNESRATVSSNNEEFNVIAFSLCILEKSKIKKLFKSESFSSEVERNASRAEETHS